MAAEHDYLALIAGRSKGPGPALARTGLRLLEPFYASAVRARNTLFDHGVKPTLALGRPTVSVGNLTTGGTGKTPVVQWLARQFLAAGRRPAVLLRGYKAQDGLSDEAELYRQIAGLDVQADPDRVAGAAAVLARSPGVDVFLLDDGFQHRRAKRDFDLVLIDAANPFGHGHVLPRGLLREPAVGLRRASAILLTHAVDRHDELLAAVRRLNATAPVFRCRHVLTGLIDAGGGRLQAAALPPAVGVAGIGKPHAFFDQVERDLRLPLVDRIALPDHDPYDAATVQRLRTRIGPARTLVTTEKDWVKLRRHGDLGTTIARAVLGIDFADGDADALWRQIHAALVASPVVPR